MKDNWKNNSPTNGRRYSEFNFYSIEENKGFEWRSFNLMGIKTWDEFYKMMSLGI